MFSSATGFDGLNFASDAIDSSPCLRWLSVDTLTLFEDFQKCRKTKCFQVAQRDSISFVGSCKSGSWNPCNWNIQTNLQVKQGIEPMTP